MRQGPNRLASGTPSKPGSGQAFVPLKIVQADPDLKVRRGCIDQGKGFALDIPVRGQGVYGSIAIEEDAIARLLMNLGLYIVHGAKLPC